MGFQMLILRQPYLHLTVEDVTEFVLVDKKLIVDLFNDIADPFS